MTNYVPLGEIAYFNPRLPRNVDESQNVSFVAMADVSEEGNLSNQETRILQNTKQGYTYFERGDVLVAKITPCFENGKAVLTDLLDHQIGFGSTEFHVIRVNEKKIDQRYLFHMVWNPRIRFFGKESMRGAAGQKRVTADFLKDYKIPLPSLPEQKHVANILDKADAIRRKRQQAIELANQFLRSVFLELFGDPITNPKGWKVRPLQKVTTKIGSGATPRGGKSAYVKVGISLIRSMNIHDDKFAHKDLAHITDAQATALDNATVEPKDVLLNITGASVCRTAIVDSSVLPARVNQHVCILRPDQDKVLSEYLLHVLLAPRYKHQLLLIARGAGATREALTKKQIEGLSIPLPPLADQGKFVRIKKIIEESVEKHGTQSSQPLFDSLSQKAFAGKL